MPPYSPLAVANTFVAQYGQMGRIDHMKLQKLLYYAYGWWLAYEQDPLLTEGPELWKYGPVFSSLYNALASSKSNPITTPQRATPFGPPPIIPNEDERTREFLDWVWQRYGQYSAFELSDMTHAPGTPWQVEAARNNYLVRAHHRIPDDLIADRFREQARELGA